MAIWDFLGNKDDSETKDERNAERIQDFINKFDITSRDLKSPGTQEDERDNATWQGYDWIKKATATSDDRSIRMKDYREMCKMVPEINQGVHIYADNGTQYNISNRVAEIESPNNKIIEILEKLFFENLDLNSTLWKMFFNMCKLGDEFYEVIVDDPVKPRHIISLERIKKPENMERVEENGQLKKFIYYYNDQEKKPREFQPWQIVHFRIENEETDPYGRSVLEAGRDTFKKLSLMEDAMIIYRITRAPERRVFYIDVGNLSTKEANKYINQVKRQFRKKQFIDPNTGQVSEKANPMSTQEDFFIGVRANSNGTRIETLPGGQNLGEVDDVKFFRDKILRTLGIPIGYLGGASEGGAAYDPKSYLSNQEIQFARTIERIQKFVIRGLEKIALVELALSDIQVKDIRKFKIKLTPPSNVDQLMEIEIRNQQFALISNIKSIESFLPNEWIYKNVLGMSEHEINNIRLQVQMEQQLALQMQAAGEGGAGGMDMSGGAGLGGNIAGGPAPAEAGGGEMGGEEAGGEEAAAGGEPGLEVAGQDFIEFDGGRWLIENKKDIEKLIKYVKLYEKVHKDNKKNKDKLYENSVTRMTIKGEFRGLLKASKNSQVTRTPSKMLVERTKHQNIDKI